MPGWPRHILMWMLVGGVLLASPTTRAEAGAPQEKVRRTVDDVRASRIFGTFHDRAKVVDSFPGYTSGIAGCRHNLSV
jgi:hypothetical protein